MTWLFGRDRATRAAARRLYASVVTQARHADFYLAFGVPDTHTGRFEMICLHIYVVLRRLKAAGGGANALAQTLHDLMFQDIDRQLREMGIGDLGVGRRVKRLAASLYGRFAAYDEALATGSAALDAALRDNLYATAFGDTAANEAANESTGEATMRSGPSGPSGAASADAPSGAQIAAMARYLRAATAAAAALPDAALLSGQVAFPAPQSVTEEDDQRS